jgi:hypothetical protein
MREHGVKFKEGTRAEFSRIREALRATDVSGPGWR